MAQQRLDLSLYDMEGSVADLILQLRDLPASARISVESEPVYVYGGWSDQEREFLRIEWDE